MQIKDDDSRGTDTLKSGFVPAHIVDDSHGTVNMDPHLDVVAGSFVTIHFIYRVGGVNFPPPL